MAAAVITVTKPSDVKGAWKVGNRQFHIRDITADTGTYATGGFSVTAASLGLKHIDFCLIGSVATSGTAGATANSIGVRYDSTGTTLTFQLYELGGTGAAGDPLAEKTNAEAYLSNFTFRVLVAGQ